MNSVNHESRSWREAAGWQIIGELDEHLARGWFVVETHPGGGQYDCLTVLDANGRALADLNREGSLHVHDRFVVRPVWQIASTTGPATVAQLLTDNLPVPESLDSEFRPGAFRAISTIATACADHGYEWRNGVHDSSLTGCEVRRQFFEAFPAVDDMLDWRTIKTPLWRSPQLAYWFLTRLDQPATACIDIDGYAYLANGESWEIENPDDWTRVNSAVLKLALGSPRS